jgi:hypothetical protein
LKVQIYGKKVVLRTELRPRLSGMSELSQKNAKALLWIFWEASSESWKCAPKKLKTNPLKLIPNSYLCKKIILR